MSTLTHETTRQNLERFNTIQEEYDFDNGDTEITIHITDFIDNETTDRDFTQADIFIGPTDDPQRPTRIEATLFDQNVASAFWTLNVGPLTLYLTPDDRRRIINALIDGSSA